VRLLCNDRRLAELSGREVPDGVMAVSNLLQVLGMEYFTGDNLCI